MIINNLIEDDKIPSPVATDSIVEMLEAVALYEGEPPTTTLSLLISEVKMWRAKDQYEKKYQLSLGNAFAQKLKNMQLSE